MSVLYVMWSGTRPACVISSKMRRACAASRPAPHAEMAALVMVVSAWTHTRGHADVSAEHAHALACVDNGSAVPQLRHFFV